MVKVTAGSQKVMAVAALIKCYDFLKIYVLINATVSSQKPMAMNLY